MTEQTIERRRFLRNALIAGWSTPVMLSIMADRANAAHCRGFGDACSVNIQCCSNKCQSGACAQSANNEPCNSDFDCSGGRLCCNPPTGSTNLHTICRNPVGGNCPTS